MRILVVDDDMAIRKVLARFLLAGGHDVETCDRASAALDRLTTGTYDVLLTDFIMPEMTGIVLATLAKDLCPGLRCYVMSGQGAPEGNHPAIEWIAKPLDATMLLSTLAR